MTKPTLTYEQLKELAPCEERFRWAKRAIGGPRKWNGRAVDVAQAVKAGATFDDLVWVASALARRGDKDVSRRLRLWVSDCAARVLHIYEKDNDSDAPRNAIIASRQYARGQIGDAAWDAAWAAAWDAARDAARGAARGAARDAEKDWQLTRLVAWFSDDEPEYWPLDKEGGDNA